MHKRSAEQIRSHSQKYIIKLIKKFSIIKVIRKFNFKMKDGNIYFNKNKSISNDDRVFVEYFFQKNNLPKIFKIEKLSNTKVLI